MSGRLDGKTAIVTGGTKGIGRAIVERFLDEGATVVATARSAPPAPFPDTPAITFLAGDVADPDHAARTVNAALERFGRIDVLVNNAGLQIEKTVPDTTEDDWDRIFDVNVKSVFLFCRAALAPMIAAGSGSIVNIGSYDGFAADPGLAAYCATKGAVHALSRAIAVDHGGQGVRCNVICPGWIKTEMMDAYLASVPDPAEAAKTLDANQPIGRLGEPGDIAAMALWLASDEAAFTTGQLFVCDGGLTARAPQP
jgi:meso-butanediol dehydrogenase/(S,S)-butanediol dehydrogenase/diacetyl reductase